PPELRAIITRALQKDPAERYRAMEHLLADLRSVDLSGADDAKTAALPQNIGDAARSTRDEEYATAELTAAGPRSAVSERLARNTADVPAKPESPGRRSFHIVGIVFAVVLLVSVVYFAASRYWTPATSINSVAVMPFVNERADPASDYIGDGITETLIKHLSDIPSLDVKPRSTVFGSKGREVDTGTVSRELNVRGVLPGRFVRRPDELSFFVEPSDAHVNNVRWCGQYRMPPTNIPPP